MSKNPLEPLTGVVTAALGLGLFGLGAVAFTRLVELILKPVCFTAPSWPYGAESAGLAPGTVLDDVSRVRLCVEDPTPWHHALGFLSDLPTPVAQLGGLLLLSRLLGRAARHGAHTAGTAEDLRGLGHYLVLAMPGAALTESIARSTLVHWAVTYDAGWGLFFGNWHVPWWAVLTGIGLLSLARITHIGAAMRTELEATV
ncbi:hypothetical protein [Saccharothrix syringae]|uniref:DUF2975 domain-containing protein n=1 Tax=Saccharothrix syringae TaxID=103733 RepID=A0A5Q0GSC2_SACSY|nr:hypothetical protein [Saccharothrix syringae]QFZ16879.1 hypothetical protein EKG83_04815 [Saccharothrix syringae]